MKAELESILEQIQRANQKGCKTVSQLLTKNHPQLLESYDESKPFFKWSETDAFKLIVLFTSKLKCCGSSITKRNRPSIIPVMYTSHGTDVAASFNGNCKTCNKVYYYSYFEDCPVSESDSNKDSKNQRSVYYDFSPDFKYFQNTFMPNMIKCALQFDKAIKK